jgi:hypothetical protein
MKKSELVSLVKRFIQEAKNTTPDPPPEVSKMFQYMNEQLPNAKMVYHNSGKYKGQWNLSAPGNISVSYFPNVDSFLININGYIKEAQNADEAFAKLNTMIN